MILYRSIDRLNRWKCRCAVQMVSILTVACTVPVLMVLDALFSTFRKPFDRAIEGEHQHRWVAGILKICSFLRCKKEQTEVQEIGAIPTPPAESRAGRAPRVVFKSAVRLAMEEPDKLKRKSPGALFVPPPQSIKLRMNHMWPMWSMHFAIA